MQPREGGNGKRGEQGTPPLSNQPPITKVSLHKDTLLLGAMVLLLSIAACFFVFSLTGLFTSEEHLADSTAITTQTIALEPTMQSGSVLTPTVWGMITPSIMLPETPTFYPEPRDTPTQLAMMPTRSTSIPDRVAIKPTMASGIIDVTSYPEPGATTTQGVPGMTESPLASEGPVGINTPPVQITPTEPSPIDTATQEPTPVPPTEAPSNTPIATAMPIEEPTPMPTATAPLEPTPEPETPTPAEPTPTVPIDTPTPEPPPYIVLSNNTHWVGEQSPIILDKTVQVAPGTKLFIDAGTEIRLGWGVALVIDEGAELHVLGTADNPVRFVSSSGVRWDGIYGHTNSTIVLDHTQIHQGGASGTVLMSEGGKLTIHNSLFEDNGGTILVTDSQLDMRNSQVYGNDLPYGGALNATYHQGNTITLHNNRFGGNRMSSGAPVVNINNVGVYFPLVMDIQKNLMYALNPAEGEIGANLLISTNGKIEGTIACNSLVGSTDGLSLRSETSQIPNFRLNIYDNLIDGHNAPITAYYIEHGIGRGATSEVELNMQFNWWGDVSGPYHPTENPEGHGDSVGNNIIYRPWMEEPPACVPPPP